MEKVERFWHNLWRKKKKSGGGGGGGSGVDCTDRQEVRGDENKENEGGGVREGAQQQQEKTVMRVRVREQELPPLHGSETFPRGRGCQPRQETQGEDLQRSPQPGRLKETHAVSSISLRGRRPADPYDRFKWTSSQHFHVPQGAQRYYQSSSIPRYRSASRGVISAASTDNCNRSHSPGGSQYSQTGTMRRPIEPSPSAHHFHLPPNNRKKRVLYGRPGQRTAMTALVDDLKSRPPCRTRSPSMNNEEPIQLAHFPSGTPGQRAIERDDFPAPSFQFSKSDDRKRRFSGTGSVCDDENQTKEEEDDERQQEEQDERLKRREEELAKISTGIGKVFLDTIRQREKIKGSRMAAIDPRSAARTPSANKEPRYRLRYDSPAWASPSRDTMHARPWDSLEDLDRPVVLTSSGCASGCTSDHFPPANSNINLLMYSTSTLAREDKGSAARPGYTHHKSQTLPYIRSVSGRVIDDELEVGVDGHMPATSTPIPGEVNSHSGILYTTNNNFSWLTLAKYQSEDTLRKTNKTTYFTRPQLKHKNTILDQ